MTKVVIVGCGVIGLYTGYMLIQRGIDPKDVSIVAKHIPGDMSHDYASPYAGAVYSGVKSDDDKTLEDTKFSYLTLAEVKKTLGSDCGLEMNPAQEFWFDPPSKKAIEYFASFVENMKVLPKEKIPSNVNFGISFDTYHFNSPRFIKTLFEYLKDKGVKITVKEIAHIKEAVASDTRYVFNCSGLGSRKLGGVADDKAMAIRAQVAVIRAPHLNHSVLCWAKDSSTYALRRPQSHNEVVLGGYYQPNNYNKDVIGTETEDILKRVSAIYPKVFENIKNPEDLHILRTLSAFRPGREGGVRIEKESLSNGIDLIHNYGAGGTGFALGLGMCKNAIDLAFRNDIKL